MTMTEEPGTGANPSTPAAMTTTLDSDQGQIVTHKVLRPFEAMGIEREPGELVNAQDWRTVKSLTALRYLAPVHTAPDATACNCCDGRVWVDETALRDHIMHLVHVKAERQRQAERDAEIEAARAAAKTAPVQPTTTHISNDALEGMAMDLEPGSEPVGEHLDSIE